MGMFGARGRSSELISFLEILSYSCFTRFSWRDGCKGMPRDRLPEKGSDVRTDMAMNSAMLIVQCAEPCRGFAR
jgi:hypothetical protein